MRSSSTLKLTTALAAILALGFASCGPKAPKQTESQMLIQEVETGNILLDKWAGPYGGVPPWDKVDVANFGETLNAGFDMARGEITKIADNPNPANFDNTIVALEKSGKALSRTATVFFVHAGNLNKDPMPDLLKEFSPKFAAFNDEINQNPALFARVKSVYDNMDELNTEQKRLVDDYYQGFVRQGATLNDEDKAKMSKINGRLATLTNQFGQNVLHDEESYITYIEDEADLAGLPGWLKTSMASAAKSNDPEGAKGAWAITNTRSSMDPFLTYSDNRVLREIVWNTYYNRGDNGDEWDNNAIITEILQLRDQRAKLLGFKTHAHWKLEDQMAKKPENAIALMEKV